MQKRNVVCLFIMVNLLLGGCDDNKYKAPKFQQSETAEFQVFPQNLGYGYFHELYVYKSWAVVVKYDSKTNLGVRLYDKETGEYVAGALHRGRGPCEFINGLLFTSFDQESGILTVNETTRNARIYCDIDKLVAGEADAVSEKGWLYKRGMVYLSDLNSGRFLHVYDFSPVVMTEECRFVIKDSLDKELFRSDEYPALFRENSFTRWHLFHVTAFYGISPSRDKLAIGTSCGAILETFDIVGDEVDRRSESYFVEPTIGNEPNYTIKNTILGFYDICATDDKIYAIYDGEHKGSAPAVERDNNIAVFDWDGKPLKIYDMGMPIEQICLDPETGLMYAVVEDANRDRYLARCDLNVK